MVIYDRAREILRRYKAMPLPELIDRSTDETLARTLMTSLITLLVLVALVVAGGPVIRDFTIAMIWGVLVGTYSTIYVASPMIMHLHLRRESLAQAAETCPRVMPRGSGCGARSNAVLILPVAGNFRATRSRA